THATIGLQNIAAAPQHPAVSRSFPCTRARADEDRTAHVRTATNWWGPVTAAYLWDRILLDRGIDAGVREAGRILSGAARGGGAHDSGAGAVRCAGSDDARGVRGD